MTTESPSTNTVSKAKTMIIVLFTITNFGSRYSTPGTWQSNEVYSRYKNTVRGPYLLKVRYKRRKVMEWLTYILYSLIVLFFDEHVLVPHMSVGVRVIFPCDTLV